MRRTIFGAMPRAVQNSGLQFRSLWSDLAPLVTPVQSCETLGCEATPPKPNGVDATTHRSGDGPLSLAFSQSEYDISATNIFGWKTSAPELGLEFGFGAGAHFKLGWHFAILADKCIISQCYSALVTAAPAALTLKLLSNSVSMVTTGTPQAIYAVKRASAPASLRLIGCLSPA